MSHLVTRGATEPRRRRPETTLSCYRHKSSRVGSALRSVLRSPSLPPSLPPRPGVLHTCSAMSTHKMQCAWCVSRDRTWWHRAAKHLPPSLPPSFASANVIITRHCKFMYIHVHMTNSCTHSKFMYSLQIPIHITNSYRKCRNRQWPAVLHIHVHTTNSCTHYADIYTGRHRQTGTQRERERESERERERETRTRLHLKVAQQRDICIYVYMHICIYVYMYTCVH